MAQKEKQEKRKKIWVERFDYEIISPPAPNAKVEPDDRLPTPFANKPTPPQSEINRGKKGARYAR